MTKRRIRVDVVSDVVCPWCYIGKRRLEKAIAQVKDEVEVEVSYLPFELNPNLPAGGTGHKEYLSAKFGGDHRYEQLTAHVSSIARQEGLQFDFSKQQKMPNTFDAHRLIQFAGLSGVQGRVNEALMKAYFEEGVDLSLKENLINIASNAGLDRAAAEQLLSSNADIGAVRDMEKLNQRRGITGVPFFIINDKYGVSGAQPADTLVQIFNEVSLEAAEADAPSSEVDQSR